MSNLFFHRVPFQGLRARKAWKGRSLELLGLTFRSPLGLGSCDSEGKQFRELARFGFSFIEIGPFKGDLALTHNILNVIEKIRQRGEKNPLLGVSIIYPDPDADNSALETSLRAASLLYDFVDYFCVVLPDNASKSILEGRFCEELLDIRLRDDSYKPVIIQIPAGFPAEFMEDTLSFAMMSGIDAIVASGSSNTRTVIDTTKGRIPVIASVAEYSEACSALKEGASLIRLDPKKGYPSGRRTIKLLKELSKCQ